MHLHRIQTDNSQIRRCRQTVYNTNRQMHPHRLQTRRYKHADDKRTDYKHAEYKHAYSNTHIQNSSQTDRCIHADAFALMSDTQMHSRRCIHTNAKHIYITNTQMQTYILQTRRSEICSRMHTEYKYTQALHVNYRYTDACRLQTRRCILQMHVHR